MLLQREIDRKKYDAAFYEALEKREFDIQTKDGIRLHCMELNDEHTKQQTKVRIAVLCHGFRCAMVCSVIYAKIFLHLGYRVILFDQRNHGESERTYSGMGYYEAGDLNEVIHWCRHAYGNDIHVITHGDSMGGSSVLLQLALGEKVDAVISDCPFSSLDELLVHQVKMRYHLPRWIVPVADLVNVVRVGFHFHEVSPINVVKGKKTPILYIHGMEDHYVPTNMSRKLHSVSEHSKLYLVPRAKHSASCVTNPSEYENQIRIFLEQNISEENKT